MTLSIWTVYDHPLDYRDKFVARRFEADKPTRDVFAHESLEHVRAWVRKEGAKRGVFPVRVPRSGSDDPVIIESWF